MFLDQLPVGRHVFQEGAAQGAPPRFGPRALATGRRQCVGPQRHGRRGGPGGPEGRSGRCGRARRCRPGCEPEDGRGFLRRVPGLELAVPQPVPGGPGQPGPRPAGDESPTGGSASGLAGRRPRRRPDPPGLPGRGLGRGLNPPDRGGNTAVHSRAPAERDPGPPRRRLRRGGPGPARPGPCSLYCFGILGLLPLFWRRARVEAVVDDLPRTIGLPFI